MNDDGFLCRLYRAQSTSAFPHFVSWCQLVVSLLVQLRILSGAIERFPQRRAMHVTPIVSFPQATPSQQGPSIFNDPFTCCAWIDLLHLAKMDWRFHSGGRSGQFANQNQSKPIIIGVMAGYSRASSPDSPTKAPKPKSITTPEPAKKSKLISAFDELSQRSIGCLGYYDPRSLLHFTQSE